MKKTTVAFAVFVLAAGIAQAATEANVYHGAANDGDFNNAANWWNPVTANDIAYFRGDTIDLFPDRANIALSVPTTIAGMNFQGSIIAGAAYNITGSTLTLDGHAEGETVLINVFPEVTVNQTIASDLVFKTFNNANNTHIKTSTGAGLVLSGTVSQDAGSQGLGIYVGDGDVEISGTVEGAGLLWKIHDNGGGSGTGILKLTGTGIWSGFGTVQISAAAEVLLARSTTDSTAFGSGVLQIQNGGTLSLGNDEQMFDTLDVAFGSGTFNLDGHAETLRSLEFLTAGDLATLDMGSGGTLNLGDQDSAALWGTLAVLNWDSGEDHIYVAGGSFSVAQLAAIAFDGWDPVGAKVEGGELLPTGTTASAYETWATDYGVGAETNDADSDGLLNVYEYGLGGDPTNAADLGISPVYSVGGGVLTYIHPQLSDSGHGLDYHLELADDLVAGGWTNAGYAIAGTNVVIGDFDYVTNEVSTATKANQFIKLMIDTL